MANRHMNSSLAGQPAPASILIDVNQLLSAYYTQIPDPRNLGQAVVFGTSGHRGCSLDKSFNESHILAICQAICDYRKIHGISGPLFLGTDTHALSAPATTTALEVMLANGVEVMIAANHEFTPTPAVSLAIIKYNRHRRARLADGIVITPSHNPPKYGGLKYNLSNGGPANTTATVWIENRANLILKGQLRDVIRVSMADAGKVNNIHDYDFLNNYVNELDQVINMNVIREANLHIGVDPMGGAGVHYWSKIAERYDLNLTVTNDLVDPTFSFMTVDRDGQIRMDPSSSYAMASLIKMKDQFDIAFACDTDHDRHGIVTAGSGLLPSNHYLTVAVDYLFQHRPLWNKRLQIGKSVVTTQLIDRVAKRLQRQVLDMPVGFKWFATGLCNGTMGFAGEESAGASFLRANGRVWTTDKDGMAAALLSAEIRATTGKDPGDLFRELTGEFGTPFEDRVEAPANAAQRTFLTSYDCEQLRHMPIASERIVNVLSIAPGNGMPIDGFKVVLDDSWLAIRPSGTEDIYKIYAETFKGNAHLKKLTVDGKWIVDEIFRTENESQLA